MTEYEWGYRCSKCEQLVEVDDVAKHVAEHRQEADWDGQVTMTREDKAG